MTLYSLTEHVAKSLWNSRWKEGLFGVFTAYLDASGCEEDRQVHILTVAGFIAPADVWIDFEHQWKRRLQEDGLTSFHMTECANYEYAFEGWETKESSRQRLLHDLLNLLKPLSRKFGCSIPCQEYKEKLPVDLLDKFDLNKAYVIAGRACVDQVGEWCRRETSPPISRVQLFFESGDMWQDELKKRLMQDEFPEPMFKPKRDKLSKTGELIEPGLIPFQAADILAYMVFLSEKYARRGIRDWGRKENIHWMQEEIWDIVPGEPRYFTEQDFPRFETLLRVHESGLVG